MGDRILVRLSIKSAVQNRNTEILSTVPVFAKKILLT